MARTTYAAVKEIMDNCTISDEIVDRYITVASALITEVFEDDTDMSDTLLTAIEQWFTAHMLAVSLHRSTSKEKVGDVSVEYTGQFRENLSSTPYGQMVMQLDFTGKMANIGKKGANIYAIKSFD